MKDPWATAKQVAGLAPLPIAAAWMQSLLAVVTVCVAYVLAYAIVHIFGPIVRSLMADWLIRRNDPIELAIRERDVVYKGRSSGRRSRSKPP